MKRKHLLHTPKNECSIVCIKLRTDLSSLLIKAQPFQMENDSKSEDHKCPQCRGQEDKKYKSSWQWLVAFFCSRNTEKEKEKLSRRKRRRHHAFRHGKTLGEKISRKEKLKKNWKRWKPSSKSLMEVPVGRTEREKKTV